MIKIKILICLLFVIILNSCSSSEPCTKIITIPERQIITPSGSSYIPSYTQEVPCDYVIPVLQEQLPVQNVTYEVLNFTFTPNTGNNTSRLKFDIKINNQNNFTLNGFPYFTTNADGTISSSGFLNGATSTCSIISPNSSCIFSYDKEYSLNLGLIQSIQLVNVRYFLNN